jgi:hypothetical protein
VDRRILAAVTAATGAWMLLLRWAAYPHLLPSLREGAAVAGLLPVVWIAVALVIPIFKVWAAIGLAFAFRGARTIAVLVLSLDVVVVVVTAARLHGATVVPGDLPWDAGEARVVRVVEMWPSYVVAGISLATVVFLVRGAGGPKPRPTRYAM